MLSRLPHGVRFSALLVGVLVASCGGGSGGGSGDEASDVARLEVVVDFNFGNGGLAVDAPMAARQLAIERSGNVLLADGYEVRRVDLRTGRITNIPGTHLTTCADGSTAERLCETGIMAVAADRVGRVYFAVVDGRIFRVPPEGGAPEHVAGLSRDQCPSGHLPIAGPVDQVCFALITDLAFDREDRLLIADGNNRRVLRLDASQGVVTVVAGIGVTAGLASCANDVPATETCIGGPAGIAVDSTGALYIAASDASVRRVDAETGIIRAVAGRAAPCYDGDPRGDGGPATEACLRSLEDVAVDGEGTVYIADSYDHRIRRVDPATGVITTFDGSDDEDAPLPVAVAIGDDDRVFALGYRSNYLDRELRRFGAGPGSGTTIAGNGEFGFCGDGGPARDACLATPNDVALGPDGAIYVSDGGALRVRRIADGVITTVAGNGSFPVAGAEPCDVSGRALDTCLNGLGPIAVDPAGALFLLEGSPSTSAYARVHRVDPSGAIAAVIGNCRVEGDPTTVPASDACVSIVDFAIGPDDALYVAESTRVSRFDAGSDRLVPVVTAAPDCNPSEDDPRPQCFFARYIALDRSGNLFITDGMRVRRVDAATGTITIVAGNGTPGTCGDGGLATEACLFAGRIVPDAAGNLFVASAGVVRRIDAATGIISTVAGTSEGECAFNDGTVVAPDLGCASVHAIDDQGRLVYPEVSQSYVGRVVRLTVPVGRPVP